jgi:hypothetical protein
MPSVGLKDKILYNVTGQTLAFEPPQGRASSDGTVAIYDTRYPLDDTTKNPLVTGTATRKAVSTTLTAAAGASQANPRLVSLSPPAPLKVGDFVWITNASSQAERRKVVAIGTSTITLDEDLVWDYPITTSTMASAEMTSPVIPAGFVQNKVNLGEDYMADWVFAVAGVTYHTRTRWDLVREIVDWALFDSDLLERFPDLRRFRFASSPDSFAPITKAAQRDVDGVLRARDFDPDKLRGNETVKYLVALRALLLLAQNGVKPNGVEARDYHDWANAEWERWSNLLLNGYLKIVYDTDEDDVIVTSERRVGTAFLKR